MTSMGISLSGMGGRGMACWIPSGAQGPHGSPPHHHHLSGSDSAWCMESDQKSLTFCSLICNFTLLSHHFQLIKICGIHRIPSVFMNFWVGAVVG